MIDRERVLARLDALDGYLSELRQILPASLESYQRVETRRACERLLQISIECVIDVCGLLVTGLRLGLPGEEDDLFEKLAQAGVIPNALRDRLRRMKGLRNILVHEYGRIDDRIVYDVMTGGLGDFETFRGAVVQALRKESGR
ncbi:MAG: type VII toxin-antitoxin system HepT family RNase toxin [Candidatus Rokuibacteriota bacterium]